MSIDTTTLQGQCTENAKNDPLRRNFIEECCDHVARLAEISCHAIYTGKDELFEASVDAMRSSMREAMRTYAEMKKEGR